MADINVGRVKGSEIIVAASQPSTRLDGKPLLEGDIWINSSNGDVYSYASGTFGTAKFNIKGPKGDAGTAGGDSVIDLSAYPLDTTTNIPVSVLQPLIDKLAANELPTIIFLLTNADGGKIAIKNYTYMGTGISVVMMMTVSTDKNTLDGGIMTQVVIYSFAIDFTTGDIIKNGGQSDTVPFPVMDCFLPNQNQMTTLTLLSGVDWAYIPTRHKENIFTKVNTFEQGINIGDTLLDEATLTGIINDSPKKAARLQSADLNDYKTPDKCGWYWGTGTNQPTGVSQFGLEVLRTGLEHFTQILYPSDDSKIWMRTYQKTAWTEWVSK